MKIEENIKKLLDALVDLNIATVENDSYHDGDLVYYLHTTIIEADGVSITREFYDLLGCDEIFVYLKDSTDKNDHDMIEIIFNSKKVVKQK